MIEFFNYNNAWIDFHTITPSHVTFYDFNENEVPVYSTRDVGIVRVGTCFKVSGYMPLHCERFSISLISGNTDRDIPLHINPRLPQNYVVRNSRLNYRWGEDEDSSVLPFSLRRGKNFVIQILVTEQRYMISLNGHHFAKYTHRLSFRSITEIEVHGDVSGVYVDRAEVKHYPERLADYQIKEIRVQKIVKEDLTVGRPLFSRYSFSRAPARKLTLPYYGLLPLNGLRLSQHLRFEGRVKLLPWSFYINLQVGQHVWPHPIIPFHFRCRFAAHREFIGKHVVTRTAWYHDKWSRDETSELTTDLRPAKAFSLVIARGLKAYEVYVDKKFVVDYQFVVNPDFVDTVYVLGDIELFDVLLEEHDPEVFYKPIVSLDFVDILEDLI